MPGQYILFKTTDGQFMFNLHAENSERILTSERYRSKDGATNGVNAVRINAANDARYDRRKATNGAPYFVVKAANNEIIGTSEQYSSSAAMENGIRAVKTLAPTAVVVDRT